MDCLICNKVHFDDHNPIDQKLTTTFCQLFDIRPTTFTSILNSSTSTICSPCSGRLVEIHGLYHKLEVIQVKLAIFRREIIEDLVKSQESTELEKRTKIIQEIRSNVYEKPSYEGDGIMSKVKTENLDNSTQKFAFFDNFDDDGPNIYHDLNFSIPPPMTQKYAQLILERIQLPQESMDFEDLTKNSYNIAQEPIASFISRDQVKFNLKKPSDFAVKIKKSRGNSKKTMVKKRGRPPKIFNSKSNDDKILNRRRCKNIKSIFDGKTNKILCSNCGLYFSSISALIVHQRIHTGELPFKCEICGDGFRAKRLLVSHQITHGIGVSSVECLICGKYMSKWALQTHMDRHEGRKNYLCDFCPKTFISVHALQKHRTSMHTSPKMNCPNCDKKFNHKANLKEHILRHHDKKFDTLCPECGKSFISNPRMQDHRRNVHLKGLIVAKKANYPCNYCEKSFCSRPSLRDHVIEHHTKDYPFKCTFEGCKSRGFVKKSRLQRHLLQVHSGKNDHICPYCKKGYAVKTSLHTHIKHYCKNKPIEK